MTDAQQLVLSGAVFLALAIPMGLGISRMQRASRPTGWWQYLPCLGVAMAAYLGIFVLVHRLLSLACATCMLDGVLYKGVLSMPVVAVLLVRQRLKSARRMRP